MRRMDKDSVAIIPAARDIAGRSTAEVLANLDSSIAQFSANVTHQAEAPYAGVDRLVQGNLSEPYSSNGRLPPPPVLSGSFDCVPVAGPAQVSG